MYSTALCYRMNKTISKAIKMGQMIMNGVAALDRQLYINRSGMN